MNTLFLLSKKQRIFLALFLAAVFFVSLLYSFYFRIVPAVDARAYDNIAWNIVRGYGYRESLNGPLALDNAIIRVGPGYEFFLAAVYYVFGHRYEVVWIVQALLLVFSSLLIFLISREIFKSQWNYLLGLSSAALVGFSPDLITVQGMLMSETLGIFLIILSVFWFCRYFNSPKDRFYQPVALGLFLGLAALVRTPAIFLFLPMAIYFLMIKKWKHLILLAGTIILVFLPWTARNFFVYNAFVPTNAAAGFNLLTGNHPGASGEQEPYQVLDRYADELGGVKASHQASRDALAFIFANPLEFLKITFYRLSIYFSFARPTGFWFHLSGWHRIATLLFSSIYSAILFIAGFWGIAKINNLDDNGKKLAKLILLMMLMMPVAIIGVVVETRYRFIIYPFFAVFAGYGINSLREKRLEWKSAFYIVWLMSANTLFDIFRNFERIIGRIRGL